MTKDNISTHKISVIAQPSLYFDTGINIDINDKGINYKKRKSVKTIQTWKLYDGFTALVVQARCYC